MKMIKVGFKNLFYWFKIIWKDRDWDWVFILIILRHKINSVIKHYTKFKYFTGQEREVKRIKICKCLLDRIIEDDYFCSLEKKRLLKINKKLAYEHEEIQEQQDMELLFKILKKHIKKWWD